MTSALLHESTRWELSNMPIKFDGQSDLKSLIAYSMVAHMGIVIGAQRPVFQ